MIFMTINLLKNLLLLEKPFFVIKSCLNQGNAPMKYQVIAYYYFTHFKAPQEEVQLHKKFFESLDVKGRVYISEEGINGQMSASSEAAPIFMDWMRSRFKGVVFKVHEADDHAFAKMTVKYRKQLVALDIPVELDQSHGHVSPETWKKMLDERDENLVLIDVRNKYEAIVGHFEGAEIPDCTTFREFPDYVKDLKSRKDPSKTRVMMYCTGGIRCEYFSVYLKEHGFQDVSQLDGGVIGYGLKVGSKHWRGKLFVFDDRLVVPISSDNQETISHCHHCNELCDTYINCANMDCNDLFISCLNCRKQFKGCCSSQCLDTGRVRQIDDYKDPKPFRKCSQEEKTSLRSRSSSNMCCCV